MTVAPKMIISPEPVRPGIPVKRVTLAVIALVVIGFALVGALISNSTPAPASAPKEKSQAEPIQDVGSKFVIDEELKKAKQAIEEEDRKKGLSGKTPGGEAGANSGTAQPVVISDSGLRNPIPEAVRRDNQNSAMFDHRNGAAASSPASGSGAARTVASNNAANEDYQLEAQVRGAKSLAFDESAPSGVSPASTLGLLAGLPGLPSTSNAAPALKTNGSDFTFPPTQTQAPSNALQSTIERVLSNLKGPTDRGAAPTNPNVAWVNEYASGSEPKTNDAIRAYPTGSRFTLHQGKTIPAILGRQINSDLPGEITAYVVTDVYDSMGYGALLIPKGSVLVGKYSSEVKPGQERVLFAFQRLIMPNGFSFDLPAAQGSDLTGASGVTGDVNNHFWKMFSTSFFTAWLSDRVSPVNITVGTGGTNTTGSTAGLVLLDVSKTILDRNRSIPPTITVDQGTRINVEVKKDMEFSGPYDGRRL